MLKVEAVVVTAAPLDAPAEPAAAAAISAVTATLFLLTVLTTPCSSTVASCNAPMLLRRRDGASPVAVDTREEESPKAAAADAASISGGNLTIEPRKLLLLDSEPAPCVTLERRRPPLVFELWVCDACTEGSIPPAGEGVPASFLLALLSHISS